MLGIVYVEIGIRECYRVVNFLWIACLQGKVLEVLYPAVFEHEVYYPVLEGVYEPYSAIYQVAHLYRLHVAYVCDLVYLSLRSRTPHEKRLVVLPFLVYYVFYHDFLCIRVEKVRREFVSITFERSLCGAHHHLGD